MIKKNINLESVFAENELIKIELGCGKTKKEGYIGIDQLDLPGVDLVGDVMPCMQLFPDASVDEIYSKSFLEHVDDLSAVISETIRILKKDGVHNLYVHHFSNPYYYSDYTHTNFFGLYTLHYFTNDSKMRRKVPSFYGSDKITIVKQRLVFTSPFLERWPFKKILELIFNSSTWMQEFYEENLCYIFPCYAIKITYLPVKN